MTTLEKLFVQIFERKDWIIEQVQRQADAYTEQLASRLLIDGITPPPCLLNPRFNSRSSDPHELKKEEIISKLLLQHPRDSIRYSTGGRSLYDRPVVARGNGQLPNEMSHAPNKGVNEPSVALACPNDDIGCSLTRVTEQDNSVNSPQNETDARISSIYAAPDTSLARIQRSKSRQKARELRTSAKAAAKSCLSKEDRTRISSTGDTISKIDFHQDKCPSEPGKCNGANSVAEEGKDDKGNGRLARSSTCDDKHTSLNDHSKTSDKEELDGVQYSGRTTRSRASTGKSSQESGHADGVIERVNLLGSYGAKNSVLGKTHDTQRQNKPYSGRTTRSRASSQQTDGLHKSLELGTSASCNPKEGTGALSYSIGDLKHGVDASNKLLKTSQARIGETQAICNSKDVKKPVISSNIAASRVTRSRSVSMKECPLGADHQENAEIAVGIGPIEVPVAVQPVNSGKKLDPVIMCTESDGLALKQSSECCMLVKPKQLNFDEMDGCDSSKISGSKKRKVDGLLGPSMDSASLKYHKSSGSSFEQQFPMENVVSSQPKTLFDEETRDMNENLVVEDVLLSKKRKGQEYNPSIDHRTSTTFFEQQLVMENVVSSQSKKAHSHDDFEECTKDEKTDISLDMNENPVMEDVEHNSEFSLHDDLAVLCEVDCQDKVKENAGGVFIPVSKPSFTSCLTKQGDNGSEDNEVRTSDQDFGSSKSKELEVGKNSKLKLDSAKVNTWPRDPQRNVEDQRNCFSDSHGFRVHIRRNAVHCELLASENDLHISQSDEDSIQSSEKVVHDEMISDSPESSHELQPAQATAPDDTLSAAEDEISNDDVAVTVVDYSDDIMPVYEGFTIDEEVENAQDFDTLEMPSTTIERASILEQICKSASTFKQHQVQDLYKLMPDGLVDDDVNLGNSIDFKKTISESDYDITEADYTFPKQQTFDPVQFSGTPYYWQSKSYYSSPVGKLWDRSASSSENRLSSNPQLTCFPIEEDPNSNEESENDEPREKKAANEEKIAVTEMAENDDEVAVEIKEGIVANHIAEIEPLSGPMKYRDRCSSNSVNIEVNVPRTYDKVKYQSKFHPGIIKSNKYEEEKQTPSISTRASIRRNASLQTQNSKNMRSGIKRPLLKRNNIVSNIMSFVPIVQQKQAAAVCPGKRDIKVKALEAAEAAKRREQEKENERKMKKEALKIERARIEKENAIEMVLNKKKKQEEMKKKEADVAARKKQREEDERKQMAKKRKIAEARKEHKVQHEKSRGGKNVVIAGNKKNVRQNKNADENGSKRSEKSFADVVQQVTFVLEKETNILEKSPGQLGSTSQEETSYDISPYQCSDDEDEDEDELPTKKFVPTWASKRAVAVVLPLQQELDPETIFAVGSFCNMDEVLLPRRLHAQ